MPIDLENIPGEEFIRLCNELESKPNIDEKMKFYFSVVEKYQFGDISFTSREIGGNVYRFGIPVPDQSEFKQLYYWAIANLVPFHFEIIFDDYKKRKEKCEDHELREFLNRELSIFESIEFWNEAQRSGFKAELSKRTPNIESYLDTIHLGESMQVQLVCYGMALARFYSALQKELLKMNSIDKTETYEISKKQGTKANIIRILYALHELNYITYKKDGMRPTKEQFFADFGKFLGEDLSSWSIVLNQFKDTSDAANRKVFEDMAKTIIEVANRQPK